MLLVAWFLAIGTLLFLLGFIVDMAIGARHLPRMASIPDELPEGQAWPRLSIVIAGRNEERNIEEALRSVLALDYPELEIVFVNDRSTDRTGDMVRQLAGGDKRIRLVEVTELPPHWLGKNHALHLGAAAASGEWILFTDADIFFERSVLRRAMRLALEQKLDHLTAGAQVTGPTLPLRMFISAFAFYFLLYARPWKATSSDPRHHVGIGAFNLVRAAKYRQAGGHAPIAMRPDDDMMLGKLMKLHGGRQMVVDAGSMIRVEWYGSIAEAVKGLEKNAFSGVDYSWAKLIGSTFALLTFAVWPWIAVFVTHGALRGVEIAVIALTLLIVGGIAAASGGRAGYALAFPLATLLFIYALWNSAVKAQWNGGIDWRGTKYPLEELRRNRL
jgi:glycosyltransferase involved in cell wall biosynthesis